MDAEFEESGLISEDDDLEGAAPTYPAPARLPAAGRQLRFSRSAHAGGDQSAHDPPACISAPVLHSAG